MRYTRPLLTAIGVGCLALSQLVVANARRESLVVDAPTCMGGTCPSEQSTQLEPIEPIEPIERIAPIEAIEPIALIESIEKNGQQPPSPVSDSTTVIDTPCLELVDVELGQTAKVVRADGQSFTGDWSADFGQVTPDGTYVAPRNIDAPGVDRIVLRASAGPNAGDPLLTVWVHLVPSSRPPVPESRALVFGPPETEPPPDPGAPAGGLSLVEQSSVFQSTFDGTLEDGPPQNLLAVQIGNETGFIVPAYVAAAVASPTTAVAVVLGYPAQGVKRSKCGVLPPIKGGCTDTKKVEGPEKEIVGPWQRELLWVEVDEYLHQMTGLPVGRAQIGYDFRRRTKYRYLDWYYCVGGQVRYAGTEICHAYGLEYRNFTPSTAYWFIYRDGRPSIRYGNYRCELYSIP